MKGKLQQLTSCETTGLRHCVYEAATDEDYETDVKADGFFDSAYLTMGNIGIVTVTIPSATPMEVAQLVYQVVDNAGTKTYKTDEIFHKTFV